MEQVVKYLESLLPEMEAFGNSIIRAIPSVTCRTFSYRHAECFHCLGMNCFPAGSNELDERCVALAVNVMNRAAFTVKARVQWQVPSCHIEAETEMLENPSVEQLAAFLEAVCGLFNPLRTALERGIP